MARAQIVEKILAQIGNGIHVENEEVRPIVYDEALGLFETTGKIDLGGRRGFAQGWEIRDYKKRGYTPIVSLEEGLRHTLAWCRSEAAAAAG